MAFVGAQYLSEALNIFFLIQAITKANLLSAALLFSGIFLTPVIMAPWSWGYFNLSDNMKPHATRNAWQIFFKGRRSNWRRRASCP